MKRAASQQPKEFEQLYRLLKKRTKHVDRAPLWRAFEFAQKAHGGQKRQSGEPYFSHCLATAHNLAELGLDQTTVIAGLLHDVPEDTATTLEDIRKNFGSEVAALVEGVTKLGKLKYRGMERYAENLRKLFVAMAKDIRVIIIKLADRKHNMETLRHMRQDKQHRIALETMEIFAPLANRLGMGELKGELEDLAFPYIYPDGYKAMRKLVPQVYQRKEKFITSVRSIVRSDLHKAGIPIVRIESRAKHLYSLYVKLQKHENDPGRIHDLIAMRIIVPTEKDCYQALGAIHARWKPLLGRIKDYISQPKANGYQSLHTTVIGPAGMPFELQLRTPEMHDIAEFGVAAHWHYDETKRKIVHTSPTARNMRWIQQLVAWQKEAKDTQEYLSSVKIDVFKNRIFVFTPQGDVLDLPEDATALDMAFAIHSEIGYHAGGAKINGKMSTLSSILKSGDVVEILVDKRRTGPSRDWLQFVGTHLSRNRIKAYFKKTDRTQHLQTGHQLLQDALIKIRKPSLNSLPPKKIQELLHALNFSSIEDVYVAVSVGELSEQRVLNQLFRYDEVLTPRVQIRPTPFQKLSNKFRTPVQVDDQDGIQTQLAHCCDPQLNDPIVGLVTARGVKVHKKDCPRLRQARGRRVRTTWSNESKHFQTTLEIVVRDEVGVLRDVASAIARENLNIFNLTNTPLQHQQAKIVATVNISTIAELLAVIGELKKIPTCLSVRRVEEGGE